MSSTGSFSHPHGPQRHRGTEKRTSALRDAPARERIARALDRNVLVEAGAGSGKTHEMARRMAAGVAAGAYVVEGMAAVTFTRKAAAELRGRFQLALEDLVVGDGAASLDNEAHRRVRRALSTLERFFAGTIHAFCAHLIRERPVEAGVAPGFRELDDVEDVVLRRQAWRDYIAQQIGAGHPTLLELRQAGLKPADLDEAFGMVTLYEEVEFPAGDAPLPDADAAWRALDMFWTALSPHLPSQIPDGSKCRTHKAVRDYRRLRRVARGAAARPAVLAELLECWNFDPGITLKWWGGNTAATKRLRDDIVALHQPFRDGVVRPFLDAWRHYLYRLAVTLLVDAREFAARERRRLNVLNYADLLQLAVRVLRENPGVRRALQQKYRWLFVDEFQDTDPVQAEILFLLASEEGSGGEESEEGPGGQTGVSPGSDRGQTPDSSRRSAERQTGAKADWRTRPLRPGALFVVGDPKQSIYRFRRADIDIYNVVRDRFAGDGGAVTGSGAGSSAGAATTTGDVVSLTTNFRSIPPLCEWANGVFAQQFPPQPMPQSPQFAALDAAPQTRASGHPHQGVFTLTVPASVDSRDVSGAEAAAIARYIRAEVDAGRRAFGDFLVLTRRKRGLSVYSDALEALEVPIDISGAGAFRHSAEVAQLALLLRALIDPQDAVSLVGVLRGPLFGVSDVDLFRWRHAGHPLSIFAEAVVSGSPGLPDVEGGRTSKLREGDVVSGFPGLSRVDGSRTSELRENRATAGSLGDVDRSLSRGDMSSPAATALATLHRWHRWLRLLPAAPAIERILEDSGYLALAAATPGGVEAGDLLHAVDRVRQAVADGQTLADAARVLEEALDVSSEVESLPLEPGHTDVVRVMNLHKAKGLEAPVVFLADPCGGWPPRVEVRIVREGSGARGYFQIVRTFESGGRKVLAEPAGWSHHEADESVYLQAEQTRLLYVAATRAREALVVGRWEGRSGVNTRAWGDLDRFLTTAAPLPIPDAAAVPQRASVDLSAETRNAAGAARLEAHARAVTASWSVGSVTAEARSLARLAGAVDSGADDPTKVVARDTPSHRADAGMAWGTLVHGLLEHAMRHRDASTADLRRLAMWLTVEEPRLREVIDEAVVTVQAVARAEFWSEAQAAEHTVEIPFAHADSDGNVMNGVIDLMYRGESGWQVIDYKTDVAVDGATAARYAAQLEAYRRALRACGLPDAGARMVHVRADE